MYNYTSFIQLSEEDAIQKLMMPYIFIRVKKRPIREKLLRSDENKWVNVNRKIPPQNETIVLQIEIGFTFFLSFLLYGGTVIYVEYVLDV